MPLGEDRGELEPGFVVQGGVALSYKALAATARDAAPAAGGDAPRPTSTWFVSVKPTGGRP